MAPLLLRFIIKYRIVKYFRRLPSYRMADLLYFDLNKPFESEFHCIREQIDEDLGESLLVEEDFIWNIVLDVDKAP